jgi:hypothetical protein
MALSLMSLACIPKTAADSKIRPYRSDPFEIVSSPNLLAGKLWKKEHGLFCLVLNPFSF